MTELHLRTPEFIDETEALLGQPFLSELLSRHPDILNSGEFDMRIFAYGACLRILAEARTYDRRPARHELSYERVKWNDSWATTQRLAKLALNHKRDLASVWRQVELAEHTNSHLRKHWDNLATSLNDEERIMVKNIVTSLNHPFGEDKSIGMNDQRKRERHTEVRLSTLLEESRLPAVITHIITASSLHNAKRILHIVSSDEMQDCLNEGLLRSAPHVSVSTLRKGTTPSSLANTVVITHDILGRRLKQGCLDNFYPIDFIMMHGTSSDIHASQNEAFLVGWPGPYVTASYAAPSSSQRSIEKVTPKKPAKASLLSREPRTRKPTRLDSGSSPPNPTQSKDDKIVAQPEKEASIPEEKAQQNDELSAEQPIQAEPLFTLLEGYSIRQEQAAVELCRAGFTLQVTYDEMDGDGWLIYSCPLEAKTYVKEHFDCFLMPTEQEIAAQFKVPAELIACIVSDPSQSIKAQLIKRGGKEPAVWCYDDVELEKIKKALRGPSKYNVFMLATAAMAEGKGITHEAAWQIRLAQRPLFANHDLPPTETEIPTIEQQEKPLAIIAKEVGVSYRTAELCLHPEEVRYIKEKVYLDEAGEKRAGLVIPSSIVWHITERLKKHRPQKLPAHVLPAYLIGRIVRDYNAVPAENINKIVQSTGSRWKPLILGTAEDSHRVDCLEWQAIAHLMKVRGKASPHHLADIDYSRLPAYAGHLDLDRIRYAQEIQRRFLKPDELQSYDK